MQQSDAQMNDSVNITGNTQDIPVMEGTTISFSCHPGLILGGPNSSTCMGNGEWEPDPREVECRGKLYDVESTIIIHVVANFGEVLYTRLRNHNKLLVLYD